MRVAAIMPCRGRAEQTVQNVRRLLATAGCAYGDGWQLYVVGGQDDYAVVHRVVNEIAIIGGQSIIMATSEHPRLTYWQALALASQSIRAPLLACLANDLLPGQHWLARAVAAYDATFGDGPGMIGFNGDSHEVGHSCHFLISRSLLERYGGWPVQYQHNYGDTELCQRAIADGLYAKAPWALLYHDHPYWGGKDDAVYQEGRKAVSRDEQLYLERKRAGWPTISR